MTKLNRSGSALRYSTFVGGAGEDQALGIRVQRQNAYITGWTSSAVYPTTPGAFDRTFNGLTDAFVTRINRAGSAFAYSSLIGGPDVDEGHVIDVKRGTAYVAGITDSADYPTTANAFDTTGDLQGDVFVTTLSTDRP